MLLWRPGGEQGRLKAGGCAGSGPAGARAHLHDVRVRPALVRFVVLRVLEQHLVHVRAGVLEQLVGAVENDQRDLTVTQHAQLVCLLHQPEFPLCKRHLEASKQAGGFFFFRQREKARLEKQHSTFFSLRNTKCVAMGSPWH